MSPGGGHRARAFGHVQILASPFWFAVLHCHRALYQRVIASVFFLGRGGSLLVVGRAVVFSLFFSYVSLSPVLTLHALPRRPCWIPLRGSSMQIGTIQRRLAWRLRRDDKIGTIQGA